MWASTGTTARISYSAAREGGQRQTLISPLPRLYNPPLLNSLRVQGQAHGYRHGKSVLAASQTAEKPVGNHYYLHPRFSDGGCHPARRSILGRNDPGPVPPLAGQP